MPSLKLNRILVPVDFSDQSFAMLRFVRALACRYQAEITLLHVAEDVYGLSDPGFGGPAMLDAPEALVADANRQLSKIVEEELTPLAVRTVVVRGHPPTQILDLIEREPIDMVAIPTHGYGPFRRLLLGSVTAKVLHDSPVPVLTGVHLPTDVAHQGMPELRRILCPVDLKPESEEVVAYAGKLAHDLGAELTLLNVAEAMDARVAMHLESGYQAAVGSIAREGLERLVRRLGVKAHIHVEDGEAVHAIPELAQSMRSNLIVIGRSEKNQQLVPLRPHAYDIVRRSPCPVISV